MRSCRPYILLLFLSGLFLSARADFSIKPFVNHYDKSLYHAGNQNWSVAVDRDGFIYVGNNNGLLEFDGSNWNTHKLEDNIVIRSVAVGEDKRIYIGSYEEFGYYQRDNLGQLKYQSLSQELGQEVFHNDEIWRIIPHDNKIYFQSFSAIYVYDGKDIKIIKPENSIVLIMKVRNSLFVHVIGRGLHEIVDDRLIPVEGSGILADDEIKIAFPHGESGIIFGAIENGLFLYDGVSFSPWKTDMNRQITLAEVNVGLSLDSLYVIGTIVNGIFILDHDGRLVHHLHAGNALQNNTVLSLARDSADNIWVGLDQGLDHLLYSDPLEYFLDPSGELGSVFDAALYNDLLWIGTNRGLFKLQYPPGRAYSAPLFIEGSQGQVWDLELIDSELIMGHSSGTYKLVKEELFRISEINGGFDMEMLETDDATYLIQSTYNVLTAYIKSSAGLEFSHTINGFLEPSPQIEIDHFGNVWTAHSQQGIYKINLNSEIDSVDELKYFGSGQGFQNDRRLGISKVEGRIAFPAGDFIYTYDDLKDTIVPYQGLNESLGEFSKASNIIPSRKHYYWFIRDQKIALFRIDGSDITKHFSTDLSLHGLYLNDYHSRIVKLKDSLHLICLERGFALYDETRASRFTERSDVSLRKVIISSSRNESGILPLDPSEQVKSIPFKFRNVSFTYSIPPQTRQAIYRYVLEGLDPPWTSWSALSEVHFTRLPYGKYIFHVQAMKTNGDEGGITSYPFQILPPWYLSKYMLIACVLLIIGMAVYLRALFLKRLAIQASNIEKEEQEKIRQEQILAEQRYTELMNEKLQAEISHKNNQLADYTMNVIRKNELLMKIREELENQKKELGERYPKYMYENLMKLIDKNITSEDEWKVFEYHFDQTHENFFKRLKTDYPELTPSDLKLCAYLRLNLSSKELAPLLNIGLKSVEVHRSRLRKKLNLSSEDNLVEFLLQF